MVEKQRLRSGSRFSNCCGSIGHISFRVEGSLSTDWWKNQVVLFWYSVFETTHKCTKHFLSRNGTHVLSLAFSSSPIPQTILPFVTLSLLTKRIYVLAGTTAFILRISLQSTNLLWLRSLALKQLCRPLFQDTLTCRFVKWTNTTTTSSAKLHVPIDTLNSSHTNKPQDFQQDIEMSIEAEDKANDDADDVSLDIKPLSFTV